tara:strand:+ start:3954 stop:4910 length:957 start_codon:yes stop_codon:yes gene_type:complete
MLGGAVDYTAQATTLVSDFQTRVATASGTFEDTSTLISSLATWLGDGTYAAADFIVTPNAFNFATIYALFPLDATRDLGSVRSTTATRVNSSGLIETVAVFIPRIDYGGGTAVILNEAASTNLLLHSQDFDNTYWKKNSSTVTANTTVAPDGTTTAETFALGGTDLARVFRNNTTTGGSSDTTFSIWLKGTAGQTVTLECGSASSVITLTADWVRHSLTNTTHTTATTVRVINRATNGNNATDLYAWGAQLEQTSAATSYIATTSAQVTRAADNIQKAGLPGTGSIVETFEDGTTNTINNPNTYFMSLGRIKHVIYTA